MEIYQRDQSPLENRDIIYETDIEVDKNIFTLLMTSENYFAR